MPGPVSDSYQLPVDPLVQGIYNAIRELDVDQATPAEDIIDAIEEAFEAHGTPTNVLTCAFCGQQYPAGTPATKHQLLTDHIMLCEKHPLRIVICEREMFEKRSKEQGIRIGELREERDTFKQAAAAHLRRIGELEKERDSLQEQLARYEPRADGRCVVCGRYRQGP